MCSEQPQQMSCPDTELLRQSLHRMSIEKSFPDKAHCARDRRRRSSPCRTSRRGLRTASETRAISQSLRSCSAGHEEDIVLTGVDDRANRTAIDSRRFHAGEECAIKFRIAGQARPIAPIAIDEHLSCMSVNHEPTSRPCQTLEGQTSESDSGQHPRSNYGISELGRHFTDIAADVEPN